MSTSCRFKDKGYKNWLKCSIALDLFKKGLHDYIDIEVTNFHAYIQQKIAAIPCGSSVVSQCGSCTSNNIKHTGSKKIVWYINCQNKICDKWLSQILLEHNDPQKRTINWKNADISKWPIDGYEVAKVYMPKGQDKTKNLPEDFDAPAILSLLKYCAWFSQKIQTASIPSDLIDIRNEVMHSGDLRITDSKINICFERIVQLLSELNIHGDVCTELQKIKRGDISINYRETEVTVLRSVVSSLKEEMDSPHGVQHQLTNVLDTVQVTLNSVQDAQTDDRLKMTESYQSIKLFLANNPDIEKMGTKQSTVLEATPGYSVNTGRTMRKRDGKKIKMTEILPYQPGMSLGRTYDLRNHSTGLDIFPEEYTNNPQIAQCPSTMIKYNVIKSSSDVYNLLDVSGDISLKVKAGILNVQGIGSYLRENGSAGVNALEILAVAHVETVSTTLTDTQPVTNWNKGKMGTHYIRSIIYGGILVVSIRIIASDSKHLEEIKANVDAGLQDQGILNAEAKADFRKIEQNIKESAEIKFSCYCTTPGLGLPRDVDSMLKTLDDFQNQLKKINDGKGAPIRCELVSLTHLDPDFSPVLRWKGLEIQLRELEEMYDEIRQAKSMLQKCLEDTVEYMTNEQSEKVTEIYNRIQRVMSSFNKVISTLDVTTAGDSLGQIQQAVDYCNQSKKLGGFRTEVKMIIKLVQPHVLTGTSRTPVKELPFGESLSIVLLGKTGHGKSATANSIFGEQRFYSHMSCDSASNKCKMVIGTIGGREICLVDTPGTMDTKNPDEALKEVGTAIAYRPRGFHAFVFVVNIDARITMEERMTITMLKKMFGDDILAKYGVFVFTHGDSFMKNKKQRKENTTFLEHIKSQGGYIERVLKECNYRCALIDNLEEDPGILRDQVINIITLIDGLVANNNGTTYTNHMFGMAQKKLEEKQRRLDEEKAQLERKRQEELDTIRKEANKDAERQIQELEAKYEDRLKEINVKQENKEQAVGKEIGAEAKKEGGCFPPDALVTLDDGRTITIADLRAGHKVLSSASSGTVEYSEVYFFAHLNPNATRKYINLRSSKQNLRLTPEHHIYIVRHGHVETIAAREVKIGDIMLVLNNSFSSLENEPVTEISESTEVGVYAPITISGTIIVNNVLASCYVDIVPPAYSHIMLSPMRQLYRLSPSLTAQINAEGKEGMPTWVQWIMDNLLA